MIITKLSEQQQKLLKEVETAYEGWFYAFGTRLGKATVLKLPKDLKFNVFVHFAPDVLGKQRDVESLYINICNSLKLKHFLKEIHNTQINILFLIRARNIKDGTLSILHEYVTKGSFKHSSTYMRKSNFNYH